jgi:hypothetical protein
MGRNKAAANGLAKPIWVRLPFLQDSQLRQLAGTRRELSTVARVLICEALAAREEASRNKARVTAPVDVAADLERLTRI